MRAIRLIWSVLSVALLVAAAGCGAGSASQSTARPTVRIISPVNGAKLSSETVAIHLSISHFTLVAGAGQAGSGQVWIYANGRVETRLELSTATLVDLSPGTSTLKAVLVTNGKPVASSAPIVVSIMPASTPSSSTSVGLPPISCAAGPMPSSDLKAGTITLFCNGLPSGGVGGDLVAGPDGNLWFTDGNAIGRITPSGAITMFSKGLPPTSSPHDLVTGPGGDLWFTGSAPVLSGADSGGPGAPFVGRVSPGGAITLFTKGLPGPSPYYDFLGGLVRGADGNLWFPLLQGPAEMTAGIGQITPSGAITVFTRNLPPDLPNVTLTPGPGGSLWFLSWNQGIGQITPSGTINMFTKGLPANSYLGNHLADGPGGSLWFATCTQPSPSSPCADGTSAIGRVTASGTITLFHQGMPANSMPVDVTVGAGGDIWFAESPIMGSQDRYHSSGPPPSMVDAFGRLTPSGVITISRGGLRSDSEVLSALISWHGAIWFASCREINPTNPVRPFGCLGPSAIGRVTPSGTISLLSNSLPAGDWPGGFILGPDGSLWFTISTVTSGDQATGGAIGRITPSGTITLFTKGLPPDSQPGNLVLGPDGNLWFTGGTAIGRIIP